jgi:hypothetical protein
MRALQFSVVIATTLFLISCTRAHPQPTKVSNQPPTTRVPSAVYRRTRREVHSVLSRIQNIGCEMGENGRTPEWYRANTEWVAEGQISGDFKLHTR